MLPPLLALSAYRPPPRGGAEGTFRYATCDRCRDRSGLKFWPPHNPWFKGLLSEGEIRRLYSF